MKKKIIAGIAALLMVAAAAPVSQIAEVLPVNLGITASAATTTINFGESTVTVNDQAKTIVVKPVSGYFSKSTSDLTIDASAFNTAEVLAAAGGSYSGYTITLDYKFALADYPGLAKVTFGDNFINAIGANMFQSHTNLETVDFGSNIKTVGNSAFNGCTALNGNGKNNTLELKNVTTVGNSAFNGCKLLENIDFGNAASLGTSAFNNCTGLKKLTFTTKMKVIGGSAFNGCTNLESIDFGYGSTVDEIGASAFAKCTALRTVTADGVSNTLPNRNILVGANLFNGDTALMKFTWQPEFTIVPDGAFNGCKALAEFTFGDADATSSNCAAIGQNAFYSCENLTAVVMPQATIGIGQNAFYGCTKLEKLVVSDNLSAIGASAFAGCKVLSLYPRQYMNDAKSNFANYANKVIIPSKVSTIPDSCFANCIGIKACDLNQVSTLGVSATAANVFNGCISLESIVIPDGVTDIKGRTFYNCTALKDVVVSPNLLNVRDYAFSGCTALETITPSNVTKYDKTIQFPSSCLGVQQYAFQNCKSIGYINFLTNASGSTEFATVAKGAFSGCEGLMGSNSNGTANNTISLPARVTTIQESAFANCKKIDQITFLGNVTAIDTLAFNGCEGLEHVYMNSTIKSLGASAFKGCKSLKELPLTTDGSSSALTQLSLIDTSTFENCTSLESAYIPANITAINGSAFKGCTSLINVVWEKNSKLNTIGTSAFSGCTSLALISDQTSGTTETHFPPSLSTINNSAFEKTALVSVKLSKPSSSTAVNILGTGVFRDITTLEKADFSEAQISEIPQYTFYGCTKLNTFVMPENAITAIGASSFQNCYYLHTLGDKNTPLGEYVLPESVTSIGANAFNNNYSMQKITFPSKTTSIDISMFNIKISEADIEKYGYTPIETIVVNENNPNYSAVNGVLFSKDKSILYTYPLAKKDKTYTVPTGVNTIYNSAFSANHILTKVTLNSDLTSIQNNAFNQLNSLASVDFQKNSTVTLGTNVFRSAAKVTLYAPAGSTAQTYANSNKNYVLFVDNDKAAATIKILDADANPTNGTLSVELKSRTYQLGVEQKTSKGDTAEDPLTWTSSDPTIATVDNNGKLTLRALGETRITVKNGSGEVTDVLDLTIVEDLSQAPADPDTGSQIMLPEGLKATDVTVTFKDASGKTYKPVVKDGKLVTGTMPAGKYTAEVARKGYTTRTYKDVNVGTAQVNLVQELHLVGDINGDGKVNTSDAMLAVTYAKKTKTPADDYAAAVTDVNNDGKIDSKDALKIINAAKNKKPLA